MTENGATTAPAFRSLVAGDLANLHPLEVAVIDFLAGYTGRTRDTYYQDLRVYLDWCQAKNLGE